MAFGALRMIPLLRIQLSNTSHPGVLGSIPKREEPGKTGAPCVKVPGSSRVPVHDEQTHPHRPRLVVSHSTCPPLSSPPHANSFVIGPAVIKHTHRVSIYSIPYPAKCWNFSSTCTFPRPPHRLPLHGKFRGKHAIYECSLEIVRDLYIGLALFHRPSSVSLWTAPFSQHCAKR
jgi:hypothetical protein